MPFGRLRNTRMKAANPKTNVIPRWRWWAYFILINLEVVWSGISGLLFLGSAHQATKASPSLKLLFTCSLQMVVFGITFGLAVFLSHVSVEELRLRWRGIIRPFWQGAAYAVALPFVIWFLIEFMFRILASLGLVAPFQMIDIAAASQRGGERLISSSALQHDRLFFWLCVTLVSFVFAGLREELWRSAFFAGVKALFPQTFESPLGQVWVVVLAAIVFGFAHSLMGPLAVLNAGLGGLGFGLIMLVHRSIWPAVIAHGLMDAVNMAITAHAR